MKLSLIAALTWPGLVIGKDGKLPWRLPQDLKRFKTLTTGHAVLMGRKTWDSLPEAYRPLPDRLNLVLTRKGEWRERGAQAVRSIDEAAEKARQWFDFKDGQGEDLPTDPRLWVIGGAEIYALALPLAQDLSLTLIHHAFEGDAHFPAVNLEAWEAKKVELWREQGSPAYDVEFLELERRKA